MDVIEGRVLSNLVALRKAAGLSQRQAENKLELRVNTLYDIEKGRLKLPFVMAVQLVELYHSDINHLLMVTEANPEIANLLDRDEDTTASASLVSMGVISGGNHPLAGVINEDPVLVAEIGLGNLGRKPLMDLLLENLTSSQKSHFVTDLYRYINSLIASDGDISKSQLTMRDTLINQAQIDLSDADKKSIARAFTRPFFGKSQVKSFPREAYKHFMIWTLHLVARMDGDIHFKAKEYIQQVAEHIQLPVSSFKIIEEQVKIAYQEID